MPPDSLRLLALDGGGVRGLSALMVLERLMEAVDPDNPPKPCDYFDLIGGTSTGGLIAIMLGRLKMTIDECIDAYLSLSDRVFEKKAHRINFKGKIQGRFNSTELEKATKEIISKSGLKEDALLKDIPDPECRVFVCATSKQTSGIVSLTSYKSSYVGNDLLNYVKIWEACRATSAASTFFDPIAIGRYGEEFVDGATGANNPIRDLWNQAKSLWGPESIEERVQCVVSIGTGVPSLKPFHDDVLKIGSTLAAISTETEQTAESFQRDKSSLHDSGRYFRFNVVRGLEEIGLEESQKRKEIAAATGRYVNSSNVVKQMKSCGKSVAGRQLKGQKFKVPLNLEGIPIAKKFISRPKEMQKLEEALLLDDQLDYRRIFVLRGLGGIGKTQLAVKFMQQYQDRFTAIFWLDGSSEDSLKQSIARCASSISASQISDQSRKYASNGEGNIDTVVTEVIGWLKISDNTRWLLVFDNVDREYVASNPEPLSYDVERYIPAVNHGSIIITTRLGQLERLGNSQEVKKVDSETAKAILNIWRDASYNEIDVQALLQRLDGLPLAIAQAGAYLHRKGININTYLRLYDEQERVVEALDKSDTLLGDYPNRSVWTTWNISYNAVLATNENAAKLLVLWSFLDRNDLWYGLFEEASRDDSTMETLLQNLGDIANDEMSFINAMGLLRDYSLIEGSGDTGGYMIHTVVHRWMYFYHGMKHRLDLGLLALNIIGSAVPMSTERNYVRIQQRLLPHANMCLARVINVEEDTTHEEQHSDGMMSQISQVDRDGCLFAMHMLGLLYENQDKLAKAENMYMGALKGYEKAFGAEHAFTLDTVNNLGILYWNQGKLDEAEKMYDRALKGKEKAFGAEHTSTLGTVNNLGILCRDQGKLAEAEKMYDRALKGREKVLGAEHTSTLGIVNNLGLLYADQGKLAEAEKMYDRALKGKEKALGAEHTSTLQTVNNLGLLYVDQGKLDEAEKMYLRALQGYEDALGIEGLKTYIPALNTMWNLGDLYSDTRPEESKAMYRKALAGYTTIQGASSDVCLELARRLDDLGLAKQPHANSESSVSSTRPGDSKKHNPEKRGKVFSKLMQKSIR